MVGSTTKINNETGQNKTSDQKNFKGLSDDYSMYVIKWLTLDDRKYEFGFTEPPNAKNIDEAYTDTDNSCVDGLVCF